ncbi:hypothetical protein [Enterobacter mori]
MTKYIQMNGWVKAVADDHVQTSAITKATKLSSAPAATDPAITEAVQQLKAQGFEVTGENIRATMELKKAGYPLNIPNLANMARQLDQKKRQAERRAQAASAPVTYSKEQKHEALMKALLDPSIIAEAQREAQRG